jgi:hypothetical protein
VSWQTSGSIADAALRDLTRQPSLAAPLVRMRRRPTYHATAARTEVDVDFSTRY